MMTDDEARSLARRIIETWPNGAKGYVWAETLKGLDYEPAMDAYRTLRVDATRTPVIGELVAVYRAKRVRAHAERPPADTPDDGGPTVSLAEYLDLQSHGADNGDLDAATNLSEWALAMTRLPTLGARPEDAA